MNEPTFHRSTTPKLLTATQCVVSRTVSISAPHAGWKRVSETMAAVEAEAP